MISSGIGCSRASSSSSRPLRWASAIRATHSGGGAEGDAVAGQAGADRERDRQMRLHIM
jgi:hypothetical protein